jgi:hypothetical protein
MSAPDNIDYLFKRLRELNSDKDFYINEEDESCLLLKKLSKLNLKITIIKESLISKGYNV